MLTTARRLAYLFFKLQLLHTRAHLEYEADFWIGVLAMFLRHGAGIVFVWVLFDSVQEVAGWNKWEVLFLYALLILPRGLTEVLANGQWRLGWLINGGELDRLLLRPVSPLLQVLAQDSAIHGFGSVLLGSTILAYASRELHFQWTPGNALLLAATIVSSVVLIVSVTLATNSVSFWTPAVTGAFPNFVSNLMELAKFPVTLYGQFFQLVLTVVVPFAFISYYPSTALLGKAADPAWIGYASPLAGLAVALLVSRLWHHGLQRYQGTGA